jgi:hypothetical protein
MLPSKGLDEANLGLGASPHKMQRFETCRPATQSLSASNGTRCTNGQGKGASQTTRGGG